MQVLPFPLVEFACTGMWLSGTGEAGHPSASGAPAKKTRVKQQAYYELQVQ